jgi:hypothetical protein
LPVVPLDLAPAHIIEFSGYENRSWTAMYACVVGVTDSAFVAVLTQSAQNAVMLSTRVHRAWTATQLEVAFSKLGD